MVVVIFSELNREINDGEREVEETAKDVKKPRAKNVGRLLNRSTFNQINRSAGSFRKYEKVIKTAYFSLQPPNFFFVTLIELHQKH